MLSVVAGKQADDSLLGRDVSDGFEDELPGPALELDTGAPGAPSAGQGGQALGHSAFSDDWDDAPGESPALDVADVRPSARAAVGKESTVADAAAPPEGRTSRAAQPAPAFEIDAYEVKALADYGSDPKNVVEAVPYALRVVRRQRELRRGLAEIRRGIAEAEGRRDQRFVELGELLAPVVAVDPQYRTLAEPLGRAEALARDRQGAAAEADGTFRRDAAAIDQDIAALDGPRAEAQAAVDAQQKVFDEATRLAQKHEARRKRVEIDVRAAKTKLDRPETSAADRAQAQALVAAADAERATRAAEEKIAKDAALAEESKLAQVRRVLADVEGRIEHHRGRRRKLEADFARQAGIRREGVDAANKEVRGALLEIGKRAAKEGGPELDGVDLRRKGISDAEAAVRRLQVDQERHLRALGSADRVAVRNGLVLLAVVVVVLLGSFIAWRALRTNPYMEGVKTTLAVPPAAAGVSPNAPRPG